MTKRNNQSVCTDNVNGVAVSKKASSTPSHTFATRMLKSMRKERVEDVMCLLLRRLNKRAVNIIGFVVDKMLYQSIDGRNKRETRRNLPGLRSSPIALLNLHP